jgi:hypothetical protein
VRLPEIDGAYTEGWRPASSADVPILRLDRVFLYVYSGALARDVAAKRCLLPRTLPGVNFGRRVLNEIG